MHDAPIRPVDLWQPEIDWDTRADGTMIVRQRGALPIPPDRLSDAIARWVRDAPDTVAFAQRNADGEWDALHYDALWSAMRAAGQVLLSLGLSTERPLVILSGNSIAHAVMALGAQYAGIPSSAIAPAYALSSTRYDKLASVRDQITPGAVFAEDTALFAPALDSVFPDLPRLGVTGPGLHMSWAELLATTPTADADAANRATGPDTVAKFLFTSGTTGSPKAVIQTQRMLCANMEMVRDTFAFFRQERPVLLDWAPWNHVASGNKVFNMALYNGGSFYIDDGKPAPGLIDATIANLKEISPNWYFNVPAGYDALIHAMREDADLRDRFFRDLKVMMYAGAAMAQHTWDALEALCVDTIGKRVMMISGLGATETAPAALYTSQPQTQPGNIGIPVRGVILKLVPNEGKWEARVKGPSITPGYWRNPDLTAAAFDKEGFYRLGDALRFADPDDPAQGFFFDGRVAENFKLATGTWVAVGALRSRLTDALGGLASDVVLTGEGRATLGALLVPVRPAMEALVSNGAELSEDALFAHPDLRAAIAERLAMHNATATGSSLRVPRAMILRDPLDLDKGEVTDKGSVNQRAVLRHRADLIEALYRGDDRVISSA